jgi:hypothetical protein
MMIVLHYAEDYTLYPHIVISSPFGDYRTSMLPCSLKHKHTSAVCVARRLLHAFTKNSSRNV